MNLARMLFKSKWQDKNPEVRRVAVATDSDAELITSLPQIARGDGDAGVRVAALKRLNEYEAWRERSTGDSDGEVRRVARNAYVALLCSNDARVPPLPRRIAELDTLSGEEMEKVTSHASDRELRAAALSRVTRPTLLAERAVVDPDPQLRLSALERITDVAVLERIAERARKTDKLINRRARELAAARRIGGGDNTAIAGKARELCERMESLLRSPGAADEVRREAIDREWYALGNNVPADLQTRYRGADTLLRQMRTNVQYPPISNTPQLSVNELQAGPAMNADTAMPALLSIDILTSQARFDRALSTAAEESQREREQRRELLREIEELTTQYSTTMEAGDVAATHAQHDRLVALTATLGALPASLETRLAPLHARYEELKRWQQWANQQRRQSICEAIANLAQANLHPDALATRVREAREEWQRLEASEGGADKIEGGMARRFHALCHRALKPTKTYFNKRDELRRSRSGEIEALLQTVGSLPAEITDWKLVGTLRQQLGDALRSLDTVDPRERTGLAKRIKQAIATIAPRIEAHAAAVEAAKKRLIERAVTLSQSLDRRSVARDTRDLQQQWTALGNGRRSTDQRQWPAFRSACDAAFKQLDAVRKERDVQSATARAQAQGLLDQIEALRLDTTQPSDALKAQLRDLDARWQALGSDDRKLEQRFRQSRDAIAGLMQDAARTQRLSRYTRALEKYALLRAIEVDAQQAEAVAIKWQTLKADAEPLGTALDARYARALAATESEQADATPARDLLVEIEFLAGVDTPAEDRQRRMNYQVQRLASRMRDRAAATPESELARLFRAWFDQPPQAWELETRFARAAQAGIVSLP